MEPLPRESVFGDDFFVRFLISVDLVSDNRVTDSGHVDTDLVSASREELDFEKRVFVIYVIQECEFGLCKLWIHGILGRHTLAVTRISSDKGLDHTLLVLHETVYESIVELLNLPICHLLLELSHGAIVLGYQDEPARVLVETMDDTWALDPVDDREFPEVVKQSIDQSSCIPELARNGVSIDSGVFTDNRKILVVEDDFQVHVFCHEVGFFRLELYLENISFLHPLITIQYFSIYLQASFFYELLHIGARVVRKKGR